ncbi:MAG: tRNA-dihydrouridine synthase family protein [Bacteroidales bacterium]|nr:tRNA-dihydrouridine synthase family protein [Bacteroidales bacterium]
MILAPMQGLTEVLFRKVYEECFPHAIELSVSPFLSLTHGNLAEAWKKIDDVLSEANVGSIPVVPQILGKEPEEFVELGNRLYELGYNEINWNMGCPMRKVTGKHRGSGILPYPNEVRTILDSVMPRLKPRLSVKMRLGLRSKDEIFALVPILNDYPLASVTVHPRLGRQQYTGRPDLDTFGEVLPLFRHPVIYNGDICTPADARRIMERFPRVADIMIGRGILYRPTLPLEIRGKMNEDSVNRQALSTCFIRRLTEEIERQLPTEQSRIRKTKEYWCLLWKELPISEQEARTVLHEQDYEAVKKKILQYIQ